MTFFYVAALAALLIYWLFLRKRNGESTKSGNRPEAGPASRADRRPRQESSEFHAVSIRTGKRSCDAVKKFDGQRILASDAPRLPLPGCDIAHCECKYVHFKDRRTGKDRRSPFGSGGISPITGTHEQERRSGAERRDEDGDG